MLRIRHFARSLRSVKPGFHSRIRISVRISTSKCVSKWKLGRRKQKQKHKENWQFRSSCACAYAYVVALTSENGVDISKSISTRPWTNHRSLWPRSHANISKLMWRTLRPPSCLSSGWGELVSRNESNMPFSACVCPYAYAYALVKTRLKGAFQKSEPVILKIKYSFLLEIFPKLPSTNHTIYK